MRKGLLALLLVTLAVPAWADIVIMNDGERKEGKIIEETSDSIKLEVTSGTLKGVLTIRRKDIKQIKKVPVDYSKILPPREYYEKRIAEIASDDAKAHFDLGVFALEKGLYREAAFCLEKAAELSDEYRALAKEHLYKVKVYRQRESKEAFEKALTALSDGRILTAKDLLIEFRESFEDCELATDKAVQGKLIREKYAAVGRSYGTDLESVIRAVEAKAERICTACEGKKTVACPDCAGSGDAVCKLCEGEKTIPCENCGGKAEVKCSVCKGYGTTQRYEGRKRVREECKTCSATGLVKCPECKKGKVDCTLCSGRGVVKKGCETCASEGRVTCTVCDGTGEKEPEEGAEGAPRRRRFGGGPR